MNAHVRALTRALRNSDTHVATAERWSRHLGGGGRLLVAGNGGSAAEAQHLTAEFVGRHRDDHPPLAAPALVLIGFTGVGGRRAHLAHRLVQLRPRGGHGR